jgi:hypothetical protein
MSNPAEYRRHARECLQIAARARLEQRLVLIEMARAWHQLAEAQEQMQFRSTRLGVPERPRLSAVGGR